MDAVSSSHPFANKVFLAKSNISSNVRETVLTHILNTIYVSFSNLFLDLRGHQQLYDIYSL